MLYNVMLIIQIIVALGIIGLVLIQHGKGADAGAAFGGGASGTVFGSKGSGSFLSRLTAILAAVFFANSLMLAWLVAHPGTTASGTSIIPTAVSETVNSGASVSVDVPGGLSAGSPDVPPSKSNAPQDIPK